MSDRIATGLTFVFLGSALLGYLILTSDDPLALSGTRLDRTPLYGVVVGTVTVLLGIALLLDVDGVVDVILRDD